MNLWAFHGRYARLATIGKTVGILLFVILLASAFVLERYHIARVAVDNGRLSDEVELLQKNRDYLQSKVSHLESLEQIGAVAKERFGLTTPRPDQIVWLSTSDGYVKAGPTVVDRALRRLEYLYSELPAPFVTRSSALASERSSE
jgi:cell division protein FtsL